MLKEHKKILLVEDEKNLGMVLQNYLELSGFDVSWAENGKQGWSLFKGNRFDLCLLDVMMPEQDGFSLAQDIRKENKEIPIIFLTARSQKPDVIKGFEVGADNYITKPFDSEILIHKMNALLQRRSFQTAQKLSNEHYDLGKFQFDVKLRQLHFKNESIKLSPKECDLLSLLCEYKNDLMPRSVALNSIWKEESYFTARSMDVYITKLRKILSKDSSLSIENYHSNGYMLKSL